MSTSLKPDHFWYEAENHHQTTLHIPPKEDQILQLEKLMFVGGVKILFAQHHRANDRAEPQEAFI